MDSFELAFSETERAADSTLTSVADVAKLARLLQKAAKIGNITAIKRNQRNLEAALEVLTQTATNAVQSWPFEAGEEEQYLRDGYAAELRGAASELGLKIHERDGRMVSHPSIVRVLPRDWAVRIDKKKVSTIRPSHLASILLQNQKKPGRFPSGRFLEALYTVYSDLVRVETPGRMMERGPGLVVPLARIYKMFTSLPGISRDYIAMEFARDLYQLETSGLMKTRSGSVVSFPASTATRSGKGVFSFVGPEGQEIQYYGVRFAEAD